MERDRLFVRHREDVGRALDAKELGDLDTARRLPQLGGRQHRHQHLLPADCVHLLADDLLDLAVDAPPEGHERPETRAHLADETAAHEELVRHGLRVSGVVAQRRKKEL